MEATRRLNGHHRETLAHVFQHPLSHNLEWHSVRSLVDAVGHDHATKSGHLVVTIGDHTETFDPRGKDLDADQLAKLRRLLRLAGYGTGDTA
jgi:hypothetical protein